MAIGPLEFLDPPLAVIGGSMYRITKGDPRTPWRPKPSKIVALIDAVWASEDVQTLSGAGAQVGHARVLIVEALTALEVAHDKKMAGRLVHWQTTCRLGDCPRQPRTGKARSGHKSRRRDFVFCPGHAGVRNRISKADYNRLQNDANLRVVIMEGV